MTLSLSEKFQDWVNDLRFSYRQNFGAPAWQTWVFQEPRPQPMPWSIASNRKLLRQNPLLQNLALQYLSENQQKFWITQLTSRHLCENFFYLQILQHLPRLRECQTLIDVGARNWSYLPALRAALPTTNLCGIELDGWRCFFEATSYVSDFGGSFRQTQYHVGSFTKYKGLIDSKTAVSFFYPFVSEHPCLRWQIPLNQGLTFTSQLVHAKKLKVSFIISLHQGEWERDEARKVYESVGLAPREICVSATLWQQYWVNPHDAFIFFTEP